MKPRIRIKLECNECGHVWRVSPDSDPQCSECNSVDFTVGDNPRERGDDDGCEYGDPRGAREERDR